MIYKAQVMRGLEDGDDDKLNDLIGGPIRIKHKVSAGELAAYVDRRHAAVD